MYDKTATKMTDYSDSDGSIVRTSSVPNRFSTLSVARTVRSSSYGTPPSDCPGSPQLQLKRADLYKSKTKYKKGTTDLEKEIQRKRKECRRLRSQSSPNLPDVDITDTKLGRNSKDSSQEDILDLDYADEKTDKVYETFRGKNHKNKISNSEYPRSPLQRKKSFSTFMDLNLKKLVENGPKLKRSQSQKITQKPVVINRIKHPATDDDDSDENPKNRNGGPWFQATTLFVPGYDFKKKSSTLPVSSRKQSTPVLSRKCSKDRLSVFFDRVITKGQSTPNLIKRDSREKMKKIELIEEKINETCTDELDSDIIIDSTSDKKTTSLQEQLKDDFPEHTDIVSQRKADIVAKEKEFRERGMSKSTDVANVLPMVGKVKQVAKDFDDGTIYDVKAKYIANKSSSDLSSKYVTVKDERDSIFRYRAQTMDIKTALETPNVYSDIGRRTSQSFNDRESGYASLTGSFNFENYNNQVVENMQICKIYPKIKQTFSNTWIHNDWVNNQQSISTNKLTPPALVQVCATDLCVTEL